jgi:hypothetical protein
VYRRRRFQPGAAVRIQVIIPPKAFAAMP